MKFLIVNTTYKREVYLDIYSIEVLEPVNQEETKVQFTSGKGFVIQHSIKEITNGIRSFNCETEKYQEVDLTRVAKNSKKEPANA